jgi:hypothetical protein
MSEIFRLPLWLLVIGVLATVAMTIYSVFDDGIFTVWGYEFSYRKEKECAAASCPEPAPCPSCADIPASPTWQQVQEEGVFPAGCEYRIHVVNGKYAGLKIYADRLTDGKVFVEYADGARNMYIAENNRHQIAFRDDTEAYATGVLYARCQN